MQKYLLPAGDLFCSPVMDSPTDLFDDSAPQMHTFAPTHSSTDLPGVHPQPSAGRPAPAFRPSGFPLIHHLLQPGGAPRRIGGQLNTNLNTRRHLEDRNLEEDRGERNGQVEQGMEGEEGVMKEEDSLLGVKKRHSDATLVAEWSQDILKVKRMKLESRPRDGEAEEGGRRREGGREGKRKEREELKEQLEEARERLQALQEKVWRAFGENHMAEEEEKTRRCRNRGGDGGERDAGMMEEEDVTEGMYDEEDIDGGEMEKETFSLLSVSPFDNFHKQREERQKDRGERGSGGGLHLEGVMEGAGLWLDCGGLVRGDWHGGIEDEGEEGGQKFAQALKLELGSAVARVIDRVLRLYTEMTDVTSSSPPAAISFLPADAGNDEGREKGAWMGLLTRGTDEEKIRGYVYLLNWPHVYTQEGLSPCHLKKAKLMFFYARYPSSNTLKTYFPDVKFNRCVTSQMIKWFSNFREFFYIQMERFARQAVREALTRDGAPRLGRENQMRVGRDTELYRILNMHYNKSNVYQVPERFIEVSEVALREFYSAIWTGRDSDPCWKKGIYKIICKLDSPVPDAFRLPGCPVG
ncbi:hypothetical protein PFLUV_G00164610 [Perca fluviatilis]|uniref:Prospero domain-containing protein n=1 Tax=Perca fluviatilis TaxID=8168 RepID=A0A6A5DXT6_PERFL|nr:hypothetical protein PFLUV_G00164610 [Perca fluviatilis]